MKAKFIILSIVASTIIYFLLGGLFYGLLFPEIYPNEGQNSSLFIFFGCLFYALFYNAIFIKLINIQSIKSGFIAGLFLGFINAISMNFFMYSSKTLNLELFVTDVLIGTISTAIMTSVIAYIIRK